MADRLDVAPTRGNYLRLQDELEQVQDGHDLLERKREVLMQEILSRIEEAEEVEARARQQFAAAYDALREARMQMGVNRLRWISLHPTAKVDVEVRTRSLMGVHVPVVDMEIESQTLPYGPGGTGAALDRARERWLEVTRLLGELVEAMAAVWRLAMELRKTQRRVNALESIIIPRYENTVDYMEQVLEEEEREDVIHAKKVKQLHGRASRNREGDQR